MLEIALPETEMHRRQDVAMQLFANLIWEHETTGFCPCPGQSRHTTSTGKRDCRVTIDGVPTAYCVHASCGEEVAAANKSLRAGIRSATTSVLTRSEKRRSAEIAKAHFRRVEDLKIRTRMTLPDIMNGYAWTYDQIVGDNPSPIQPDDREEMFRSFMGLFKDADIVWIGDVTQTGGAQHAANFLTKEQWCSGPIPEGPYTCPSCFATGSSSRSKDSVTVQRYLVVESDLWSKNEVGAIFHWLDQSVKMPLRAIVDTAGKSLHGWFEFPSPDVWVELKIMLPVMGCDPKMFGSSQPCRLPGALREGRVQKLIYSVKGGAQ